MMAGRAPDADSEGVLLARHLAGEAGAFAELVKRYRSPVYSYLVRTGVAEADRDDLFQEVFVRVHRAASSFRADKPLHPWLFTIVANAVRTYHRRRRVRALVQADDPLPEPASGSADGERSAAARQVVDWLERELEQLPLIRREVLLLAGVEGLPLKDVGRILGLGVNTVKTHLRRARLALAEGLAKEGLGEVQP